MNNLTSKLRILREVAILDGAASTANVFGASSIHSDLFDCSDEGQILADIDQAQTDYSAARLILEKDLGVVVLTLNSKSSQ